MTNKPDGHSSTDVAGGARSDTHTPGQDWTTALTSWRHAGLKAKAFITNQRGIGFDLHGGTRRQVLEELCAYLDKLEGDRAELLEACRMIVACGDLIGPSANARNAQDAARAAIERATAKG